MKKMRLACLILVLAGLLLHFRAYAQEETLRLTLSRDFGYSGFGNDIQGLFSMRVSGPSNLVRVEFYIDTTKIGEATQAPFRLQFNTGAYPMGLHTLYAIGYTDDGQKLNSQVISVKFVPASEGTKAVGRIVIPLLAAILLAILLATLIPILTGRRTVTLAPGSPRQYPLGGAICPKCRRPFQVHFYGLNLLGSKFDRCPYCGKWSVVRLQSIDKLRAAEQAELEGERAQMPEMTEEEKLKKELDESKYQSS